MLSYSPLTLPADRLFFDEETKKFYDKTTGDEVSGWNLADGYTVYAQISKGGSCFAYRGLHEGRFVIVKELIPASFCPFLTRREDGSIVFDDELSYSHSYLSKIKEKINNAYQHEIDMSHRLRYKGSNNDPRFFSVNEIPTSSASLAKYLAIDTSAGDTLDTYVLNHPQYQPHSPKYDIVACLNLAKEVAYAIGEIHAKGFLHLDVKPSNLFRSELAYMQHGASLIHPIDMGSAVAMLHSGHIDESTVLYGSTPEYASIELHNAVCGESLRRRKAYVARITKATDTYSICKMLSKWLPDENESTMPDPVKRLVYQRIIERGLSIDVKSRFQDTGGLIQALDSAIDVIQRRGISCEIILLRSKELYQSIASKYKVDPRLYTATRDEQENPVEHVLDTASGEHHQLIGPGGSGKTTLFYKLWGRCFESRNILPIYLNLAELSDGCADNCLKDKIISQYCGISTAGENDHIRRDKLMQLLNGENENSQLFLLLLDGVQESGDPNGSQWRPELETIAACKQVRILMSSRYPLSGRLFNNWTCLFLEPIEATNVTAVLGTQQLPAHLLNLLTRPMFLSIYLRIGFYANTKLGTVRTEGELFDIYFDYLVESGRRVSQHTELVENQHKYCIRYLLPAIAYTHGKMLLDDNSFDTVFKSCEEQLAGYVRIKSLFDRDDDVLKISSGKALKIWIAKGLIRKTETGYLFSHQNYFDFAKALYVYNEMNLADEHTIPECLSANIPLETLRMAGELFREYLWEEKRDTTNNPSPIEDWMQRHCRMEWFAYDDVGKAGESVAQCVEMMKLARGKNVTADYSGLNLKSCDFLNCTLAGSRFDGSSFRHSALIDPVFGTHGLLNDCKSYKLSQDLYKSLWKSRLVIDKVIDKSDYLSTSMSTSRDGSIVALWEKEELLILRLNYDGDAYYDRKVISKPLFPNHKIDSNSSLFISPSGNRLYVSSFFFEDASSDDWSLEWLDISASLIYYDLSTGTWYDTGLRFGYLWSIAGISPDGKVLILHVSKEFLSEHFLFEAFETEKFHMLYEISRENLLRFSLEIGLSIHPSHPFDEPGFGSFSESKSCFFLIYHDKRIIFSSDTGTIIGLCQGVGQFCDISGYGDVISLHDDKGWHGVVSPSQGKQYGILAGIISDKSTLYSAQSLVLVEQIFSDHIMKIAGKEDEGAFFCFDGIFIRRGGVFIYRYALDGSLKAEYPISAFAFDDLKGKRIPRVGDAVMYQIRGDGDIIEYNRDEGIICVYHLPQKRASVIFELPNQYLELFDKERPFVLVHAWSLSPDNSCAAFFTQNVISYRFEIVDSENVIAKENITGNYSFQSLVWNRKAVTLFCADESSTTISKSLVIHWDGGQFYKRSVEGSLFFPCPQDNHIVLHVTPSNSESGLCRCTLLDLCDTTTRYEFEISREVKGGVFKGRRFDECFDHSDFYGTTTLSIDKMPDAPFYLDQEHKTLFVIAGSRNVYCGKLPENGGTLFLRRYFLGVDAKDIRGCHFEKAETTPETFRFLHMNGGIVPPEFR